MTEAATKDLAKSLTLGDTVGWRLHWLGCDLRELQREIRKTIFGTGAAHLESGPFKEVLGRLKAIEVRYGRLRWETQLMLGLDYDDEVAAIFVEQPKQAEYDEALRETRALLQAVVDRLLAAEAKHLQGLIDRNAASMC